MRECKAVCASARARSLPGDREKERTASASSSHGRNAGNVRKRFMSIPLDECSRGRLSRCGMLASRPRRLEQVGSLRTRLAVLSPSAEASSEAEGVAAHA